MSPAGLSGSVLFVCTGNICRSPFMAAAMTASLAAWAPGLRFSSAGTQALPGSPMDPFFLDVLANRGIDCRGFGARRLTAPMVRDADLILTAERSHRGATVRLELSALRRTFTLRQAVRLLERHGSVSGSGLRQLAEELASARGLTGTAIDDDDIIDPHGRSRAVYRTALDRLDDSLAAFTDRLGFGSPGSQG